MSKLKSSSPPKLALRLFRWYCRGDRLEELEGDLEELFYYRLSTGSSLNKTRILFWWNVFRCFRSYAFIGNKQKLNNMSLYRSYFKLALRHSWKNMGPVTINVVGLGLALSMCITVYVIHAYNMEFDEFYPNTEDIYRIHNMTMDQGQEYRNEVTPLTMQQRILDEISGVSDVTSYFQRTLIINYEHEYFSEAVGLAPDNFFEFFDIPLVYGSLAAFDKEPSAYLTKAMAIKYFGDENAVGKTLTIQASDLISYEVVVQGVFEKIPLNTSFDFNLLVNQKEYLRAMKFDITDWNSLRYAGMYLRIANPSQVSRIEESIQKYIPFQNEAHEEWKATRFEIVPFITALNADHLMSSQYVNTRLRPQVLIIFIVLVSLVIFTACFNMANTSMSMISTRLKEIGIRKTLGSPSKQILIQFLFEMGIVTSFAFVIAVSMANFTTGSVFGLFGVSFLMDDVSTSGVIVFVILFLLFTTALSGLVPALYAWKFQPVAIMRKSVKLKGVNWLNKGLTVAQFSFSIAVLVAGYTFSKNAEFMNEFNLGYQMDSIYDVDLGSNEKYAEIKQEVDQIPGIEVVGTWHHIGKYGSRVVAQIDTAKYETSYYQIGEGYLELMELNLITGRGFIKGSEADKKQFILVNDEFAKKYFSGEEPLNQVVKIDGERRTVVGVTGNVLDGVYSDSNADPMIFALTDESNFSHVVVKVVDNDLYKVDEQLRDIWKKHIDKPYSGEIQRDVAMGSAGRDSINLQKIFTSMAILGCLLSIAGIFSLATLNVAKRVKEISIRKVLGASVNALLMIINKSFIWVLMIALIIGVGLGYLVSDAVLGMIYKYYVDISIVSALAAGLIITVLSVITVTTAVFKPASANPSDGLRVE